MFTLIEKMQNTENELATEESVQFEMLRSIVFNSDSEALELYHSKGYPMNPRNNILRTPAFYIEDCSIEFVQNLVDKGMELNVLDLEGNNIIQELAVGKNESVLRYVLSKGVNPHEENNQGFDAVFQILYSEVFPPDLFREHSMFEDDISYKEAVLNDNYELSLSIIQRDLQRLGGIQNVLSRFDYQEARNYIRQFHSSLLLNKKFAEANMLQQLIFEITEELDFTSWTDIPLDIIPAILTNNRGDLVKFSNRNILMTNGIPSELNKLYALIGVSQFDEDCSFVMRKLRKDGQSIIKEQASYVSKFFKILFSKSFSTDVDDLEYYVENGLSATPRIVSTHYYALGMVYFYKGEFVHAEYMFNAVIKLVKTTKDLSCLEYAQAHAMRDFMSQKREG